MHPTIVVKTKGKSIKGNYLKYNLKISSNEKKKMESNFLQKSFCVQFIKLHAQIYNKMFFLMVSYAHTHTHTNGITFWLVLPPEEIAGLKDFSFVLEETMNGYHDIKS